MSFKKLDENFSGTIVVIGTPAEETVGGKCELVEEQYTDIDAVIQMHLGAENNINVVTLAMDSIEFNFSGVAHAAVIQKKGKCFGCCKLNVCRSKCTSSAYESDARVAGIITEGGMACNIIPDKASCRYYIRSKERSYLLKRINTNYKLCKGAALMTGTELEYHNFENSYDNLVYNESLRNLLRKNLEDLGIKILLITLMQVVQVILEMYHKFVQQFIVK